MKVLTACATACRTSSSAGPCASATPTCSGGSPPSRRPREDLQAFHPQRRHPLGREGLHRPEADGRKLDKHIGTFDTRREAKAAEGEAIKQFATKSGNETIAEFADRWLDDYPRERNSTRRCREQAIKKFIAARGKRLPQTVTRQEARKWAMTHRSSHASLRAMWQDMLNEKIVGTNP